MSEALKSIRSQVRDAITRRGPKKFDVWTGYASKGGFEFVLDGTPNTRHLVWMEGDPEVVRYEIPASRVFGCGNEGGQATIPDAIVWLRSGKLEWREIKTDEDAALLTLASSDQIIAQTSAAATQGAHIWRLIPVSELDKHAQLIINWQTGLAYLWAASSYDLAPFIHDIYLVLRTDKPMSLSQVTSSFPSESTPLLLAAFFRLAQYGKITTDLANKPFCRDTVLKLEHT